MKEEGGVVQSGSWRKGMNDANVKELAAACRSKFGRILGEKEEKSLNV